MMEIFILHLYLVPFWPQANPPLKPISQFDIITNYQLKKKPTSDNPTIVYEHEEERKETGTDLLPYLIIQLKVKRWNPDVDRIRVVDGTNKMYLKKKANDSGVYDLDLGYIDDIKDGITSGNFVIHFLNKKKVIEIITFSIDREGSFFVNGEKRGRF
jgi:hypothetical protein